MGSLTSSLRGWFPTSGSLHEREWRSRHRALLVLLWLHVPFLVAYQAIRPDSSHSHGGLQVGLSEVSLVVLLTLLATFGTTHGWPRRVTSTLVAAGLLSCSATLVGFAHGLTEAHFHFFVVMGLLVLYEDWVPLLLALAYVLIHHGVLGTLVPESVFYRSSAQARPWQWAALHALFILGAVIAGVINWRMNETAREEAAAAERRAKESELRFEQAFDDAPIGISLLGQDGRIVDANRAFCEMFDFEKAALLDTTFLDLMHPDDRDDAAFEELAAGVAISREGRYLDRSGSTVWALLRASQIHDYSDRSPAAFVVQIQDVTADHLAKELLERRERQLAEAQQIARLGSWEWNTATGEHLFSDEIYRVFGVRADDFKDTSDSIMSFVHPDDREHVVAEVEHAVKAGGSFALEHRMVRADGEIRHVHTNGRLVTDADGATRLVGTLQDVTERQLEEQHRHDLEHQLRQSQKLEAVGQLAGGVAHDFNNLLVAVFGATEMAAEQVDRANLAVQGHLATIKTAADRAASLTSQLLAFSHKQLLEPEILDVNDVIAESEELLRRVLNANIELDFAYDRKVANVLVDATQLSQVIMNLGLNARDAMPHGGTLAVAVADAEVEAQHRDDRQSMESGSYVLVTVRDTGTGMAAEARERAFEPFFTTKPVGLGTGLGLSTVYGIVKQSGGFVWLDSELGRGTTFRIYLPAVASSVPAGEPASERDPGRIEARVILAEDDDLVRATIVAMLEQSGAEVRAAASGGEALALCKDGGVDILLTDIAMPDMNGFDVAEEGMRHDPDLRVLYISGYALDDDRALEQLPGTLLRKPFTRHELVAALADALQAPAPAAPRAAVRGTKS